RLWDVMTGREIHTLRGHTADVRSAIFSPNGKLIASGSSDATVKLWDAASGRKLQTLKHGDGEVWHIAFSSNGEILASGSGHSIKLWNVQTGGLIESFSNDDPVTMRK